MAKSYYSIVLAHPADEVWAVIRPFDHYAWAGVDSETIIEEGKAGDQVSPALISRTRLSTLSLQRSAAAGNPRSAGKGKFHARPS